MKNNQNPKSLYDVLGETQDFFKRVSMELKTGYPYVTWRQNIEDRKRKDKDFAKDVREIRDITEDLKEVANGFGRANKPLKHFALTMWLSGLIGLSTAIVGNYRQEIANYFTQPKATYGQTASQENPFARVSYIPSKDRTGIVVYDGKANSLEQSVNQQ